MIKICTYLITLSLFCEIPLLADFAGTSNFNDLSQWTTNPTVNGSPINTSAGTLQEEPTGIPNTLTYVDSSSTTKDQDIWTWNPGAASSDDSWIMSMGVLDAAPTSLQSTAEIGFGISKSGSDLTDNLDLVMASYQGTQGFRLNLTTGGASTHYFNSVATYDASILLWYDQPSDTLHCWYNDSPADPYFTDLADINLAKVWGLESADSLTFFTIGASTDNAVSLSTPVFGYNFSLQDLSETPEPSSFGMLAGGLLSLIGLARANKLRGLTLKF